MAAQKFLQNVGGKIKEIIAAVTSTANAIVAMDSSGHLDMSVLPVGIGAEVLTMVTSENLSAGDLVNIYSNAGVLTARKADATTNAKQAHGFTLLSVTSPASATIYMPSTTNTATAGLTIGTEYYLSTTPGGVTSIAPSTTGNIVQRVGIADKTTEFVFVPYVSIEIA